MLVEITDTTLASCALSGFADLLEMCRGRIVLRLTDAWIRLGEPEQEEEEEKPTESEFTKEPQRQLALFG